jgi:hypothetical protein
MLDQVAVLENYENVRMSAADAARWRKMSSRRRWRKIQEEFHTRLDHWSEEAIRCKLNYYKSRNAALRSILAFCRASDPSVRISTLLPFISDADSNFFWTALIRI